MLQNGLQIGAALEISSRGKMITNHDSHFKSVQEGFQTAVGIINRGKDYKSVQNRCLFLLIVALLTCK